MKLKIDFQTTIFYPVIMAETKSLFKFNFIGGGINQVHAHSKDDVVEASRRHLGSWADKIDISSIQLVKPEDENAYYKSLPLMD